MSRPSWTRTTGWGPAAITGVLLVLIGAISAVVDSFAPHRLVDARGQLLPMSLGAILWIEGGTYFRWVPFAIVAVAVARWSARAPAMLQLGLHLIVGPACIAAFALLGTAANGTWNRGLRVALTMGGSQGLMLYAVSTGAYLGIAAILRSHETALTARVLETQLADARLDALRVQLQPHFLFNSLHAISSLIATAPADAQRMITLLAELLRSTLDQSSATEVALSDELAWIERYLSLQRLRFGAKLQVAISAAPAALSARVPPLVLQPLVENALVHGTDPETGAASVVISATVHGARLVLVVSDSGPGLAGRTGGARVRAGSGVGLRNTRERLQAAYGDEHSMELAQSVARGTTVTLDLPLHRDAQP
ncbi:MAG: histidine kinase internal region [Gemmatimonadetes bacterium]|nr:histidine kinase internal region [Gemmatimonadota bacterium]